MQVTGEVETNCRIEVEREARVPSLVMGFQAPALSADSADEWEPYALEVLAYVLDGGQSARFETSLVRDQQIASSIWTSYNSTARLDNMIMFGGTPADGRSVDDLEQAIRDQLAIIKSEPVSQDELDRVKAQLRASEVFEKDSIFRQAMTIGQLETIGLGWELEDAWLDRIGQVTPEQVTILDLGQNMGTLSLALRNFNDTKETAASPATVEMLGNLLAGLPARPPIQDNDNDFFEEFLTDENSLEVVVAKKRIKRGTQLTSDLIELQRRPKADGD